MSESTSRHDPGSPELPILQPLPAELLGPALPRLLDALSDAVVVVDRRGHIVATNKRFAEAFGLGHSLESACRVEAWL